MRTWRDKCHEAGQNCGCDEVCMFAPTGNAQSVIKQLEDDLKLKDEIIKKKDLLIFELKGQIRNLEDTLGIEYNGS
jgi:hypothetical protein